MPKTLTVGTRVRWTSASQGYTKTKEGVIEAVVAPGHTPHDFVDISDNQRRKFTSNPRDHVSYLVRVRKCTFYWPLVKNLTVVKDDLSAADRKAIKRGLADSAAGRVSRQDFSRHTLKGQVGLLPHSEPWGPKTFAKALILEVRNAAPEGDYYKAGVALAKALVDGGASLEELLVLADTVKGDIRKALQVVRGKG